jgi:hypothetical protein
MCHRESFDAVHEIGSKLELSWFKARGVDAIELADDLWEQGGPYEAKSRNKTARSRGFQRKTGLKSKPDQEKSRKNWPSSQQIRSQGFGKQKRKINGRKFNGEAVRYD